MTIDAARRFRLLSEIARLFAEAVLDERALFEVVAEQIAGVTGYACVVRLLSEDEAWIDPVATHHPDPELREAMREVQQHARQRADTGIWKRVIGERRTVRSSAAPDRLPTDVSPEQLAFIRRFPALHFMGAPLIARGRVIGAIALVRFERDATFSDEDDAFLGDLADRAALAIDNARLIAAERRAREAAERAEAATRQELAERQKAEAALRQAEEKFRQAQKMEAMGRLAGGIAHDFNNVLSVILGYSDMILDDLPPGDPIREDLGEIHRAGERAAALTRQLLAFSRQQVLEPRVLEINEVIRGIERMLRRILGEDIELAMVLDPALHRCRVDPGQLEQVLMNLVVNARDAMPRGGKLTIETSNTILGDEYVAQHPDSTAGPHVVLAVSDTGEGMDRATQARIFEPFFTTKPKDRGTGLGLATVYGIVKQSGGSIWLYSEPGRGTMFKIHIPRAADLRERPAPAAAPASATRGTETVLLVEDEEQVRTLARGILRRAGYQVLEATGAGDAITRCRDHDGDIHLLLTDVVMPRISGHELSERLRPLRPAMKIVFMSGYTEDAVVRHGILEPGINYLPKPITPDVLLRKVRQVLDA